MKVASFIDALESLGYEERTYPMTTNKVGNIVVELQVGHNYRAEVILNVSEDEFILSLNGVVSLATQVQDNVIEFLENYIADFGY